MDETTRERDYGNAFEARLGAATDGSGEGGADSTADTTSEAVNPMMGHPLGKADRDVLYLHVRAVVPPAGSTEQPISQEYDNLEVDGDSDVQGLVLAVADRLGAPKDGAMPFCKGGAVAWTAPHPVDARVLCDGQALSHGTRLRDVPALSGSLLVVAFQPPTAHVV